MEYACIALCHFCDNHGPRVVTCTQTGVSAEELESAPTLPPPQELSDSGFSKRFPLGSSMNSNCCACTPEMPDSKLGFVSSQNNSVFVSKHLPACKEALLSLRKACCRCYNSEQTAKKEGEVVFGDPSSDYVLSYRFYLKDSQARGFRKLYSIMVLTHTPAYLYQFSSCITRQLEAIVTALKEKSDLVHASESALKDSCTMPRAGKHVDPDLLIRARASVITEPRALSGITGDSDIFHFIHCRFSSLLKTHLPPSLQALDSLGYLAPIIDKHQLQLVLLGKQPSSSPAISPSPHSFSNLRQLARTIGGHIFDQLLYHLYTGHQVVIRGEPQTLVSSALHLLSSLLPDHCVRACEYEKRYQSPDKCNLLGLQLKAHVPNHFFSDPQNCGVILDIFQLDSHSRSFSETETDSGLGLGMGEDPLDNYAFQIQPDTPLYYNSQLLLPTVLTHLHNIIYPKIYSEDVVRLAIESTKQSILTKVTILKKCARIPASKQLQQLLENKLLAVIHASKADLPFLEFWSLPYDSIN